MQLKALLPLLALAPSAFSKVYRQTDKVVGKDFYDAFNFEAVKDPSGGRVEYVDQATAIAENLTYASHSSFVMRADHTTVLDPAGPGRKSVRISSKATWGEHVSVFNIRHIPEACGTWPGLREKSGNASTGLIDIIEGKNNVEPNLISLHTMPNCTMPSSSHQSGTWVSSNCDSAANGNQGCGVEPKELDSYGPDFNKHGGGWYAVERTDEFIKIWFWPRHSQPPVDVLIGSPYVNTAAWGTPTANYPNTSCDLKSHFGKNYILINLTFCGGFAGNNFNSDGCPGNCIDYVNSNPEAFAGAYWEFESLRVYQ